MPNGSKLRPYLDGREAKHDLVTSIDVRVQDTQDMLKLVRNNQRLQRDRNNESYTIPTSSILYSWLQILSDIFIPFVHMDSPF